MRACLVVIAVVVATIGRLSAEPVAVRYLAGLTHGFVSVKTTNGRLLGGGELIQTVRGDRVTGRLLPQLEPFPFSGVRRQVTHDILNVDIGGLKGIVAKLLGKQPPSSPHLDHGRRRRGVRPGGNADSQMESALGSRTERPCV